MVALAAIWGFLYLNPIGTGSVKQPGFGVYPVFLPEL